MLCACLLVPTAFAADEASIVDALKGADLGALNADEISALLGDLDLSEIDIDSIVADSKDEGFVPSEKYVEDLKQETEKEN